MAKNKSTKVKDSNQIGYFQSIKFKFLILIIVAIVAVEASCVIIAAHETKQSMESMISSYMYDDTLTAGYSFYETYSMIKNATGEGDSVLSADYLEESIGGMSITELQSAYFYVVSGDGTMLYHPTAEKIGEPVTNEVVAGLCTQIQGGTIPDNGVTTYEFNGETKFASYFVAPDGGFIIVCSADYSEVSDIINNMRNQTILISSIVAFVFLIICVFVLNYLMKPIMATVQVIRRMTSLDFTTGKEERQYSKRSDEFGFISRAIIALQKVLSSTIENIRDQSNILFSSSDDMYKNASDMNDTTAQVDSAVTDIAQGATNQADETMKATNNVITIGNMIEETSDEVNKLKDTAEAMSRSHQVAMTTLKELGEVNEETKGTISTIAEQTAATNESTQRIREVTALISDIAEETNLLSLNASIEAARAGEAGRGFAVVASQIQKLAEQSDGSAKQIENIIDQLIKESSKSVETMEQVKEIIERQSQDVDRTGKAFEEVSEGIAQSKEGIEEIAVKIRNMDEARDAVVETVQNLSAIAEENAASTEESSASVSMITGIASSIEQNSSDLKSIAQTLNDNMSQFVVDGESAPSAEGDAE